MPLPSTPSSPQPLLPGMLDRMAELRRATPAMEEGVRIPVQAEEGEEGVALQAYFQSVASIQEGVLQIEHSTEELKELQREYLASTNPARSKELSAEIDGMMADAQARVGATKGELDALSALCRSNANDPCAKPAEVRIQRNQLQKLTMMFAAAVREGSEAGEAFQSEYKEQVVRRIRVRFPSGGDGRPMDDARASELARQLLEEGREDAILAEAEDTRQMLRENHREIRRIEASVRDLHHTFCQLKAMVEEQDPLFDDIAREVGRTTAFVASGRSQLQQAREYSKRSRSKMCMFACCIVVVLLLIVVPTTTFALLKRS